MVHRFEVKGLLEPAGWFWVCSCAEGEDGFPNEAAAVAAAEAHAPKTARVA